MQKMDLNKRKQISQAINFIEELAWLLDSKKGINLKELSALLRNLSETGQGLTLNTKYESSNPNKHYLIGILPNLFQDEDLFKTNIDLSDFAETILKVSITRAEKRSKYELIGLIVCEVTNLDDDNLSHLVNALSKLTGSKDRLRQIKEARKKANFSWNQAIQELSKG